MKERRSKIWLLLAALMVAIAAVAAGCGGDDDDTSTTTPAASTQEPATPATDATTGGDTGATATDAAGDTTSTGAATGGEPITIGFLSDCEGPFGPFWENTIAGMNMALIEKAGATAAGQKPSDGVEGANINGVPIEINTNYGCSDDTAEKALAEVTRLVEQEGVDLVVGPLSGDEGIAVANYAKDHPEVTFVNGSAGAQDATLHVGAENFFRFNADGAQMAAGLGAYAYNVLGWRNVVTMGDDYSFPYTQIGGFIAEFCSLGGNVTNRIWPALGEEDYSSYIAQIPEDTDGFFLGVGGTGTVAFVKQYEQLKGNLGEKVMGGVFIPDPLVLKELGNRMVGVATAAPQSGDSTEAAWTTFRDKLAETYPDEAGNGSSVFIQSYYANTLGLLTALEQVGGDISDGQAALREALAATEIETPFGPVSLDDNRQAVVNNYLLQIVENEDGSVGPKTLATVPEVDQSFGGKFTTDSPPLDRENPPCEAGSPPPWTTTITPETVGAAAGQ